MTVTVPVPLTSEQMAALEGRAKAQGVSVDSLLHKAILQIISTEAATKPHQPLSPDEMDKAFEEIADMIPENVQDIPDDALSRESIYTREDEW